MRPTDGCKVRNLLRAFELEVHSEEREDLIRSVHQQLLEITKPERMFLFGSAVTGKFDRFSDLDFLLFYLTAEEASEEASEEQRKLYRNRLSLPISCDFVCVHRETFDRKSDLGGVCYVALNEGRELVKGLKSATRITSKGPQATSMFLKW